MWCQHKLLIQFSFLGCSLPLHTVFFCKEWDLTLGVELGCNRTGHHKEFHFEWKNISSWLFTATKSNSDTAVVESSLALIWSEMRDSRWATLYHALAGTGLVEMCLGLSEPDVWPGGPVGWQLQNMSDDYWCSHQMWRCLLAHTCTWK